MFVLDAPSRRGDPCLLTPHVAFLVHHLHTVADSACSKEDEEVLKAEYQKNPKPDKAARVEIVSKVALGEKEVQVGVPRVTWLRVTPRANELMPTLP